MGRTFEVWTTRALGCHRFEMDSSRLLLLLFLVRLVVASILAAAFTTFAAAMVMLFTIITFFEKFAIILFLTIAQSTIGSFVVFLVMVDCIGPADPTFLMDRLLKRCYAKCGKEYHIQAEGSTQHFTTKEFNALDRSND